MSIKISLIVPVYNCEKYLEKCLESVMKQDLAGIEVIIINDGSEDNSLEIVEGYKSRFENIYIINQENKGQGAARNLGIKIAKGEYIGFIDADDYIDYNMMSSMYYKAISNDYDIVTCGTKIVNEDGNIIKEISIVDSGQLNSEEAILSIIKGKNTFAVWNKIFKRKLFIENNIFFKEGCYYEDIYVIIKAFSCAKSIYNFKESFYYYVQHDKSTTKQKKVKYYNDLLMEVARTKEYINDKYPKNKLINISFENIQTLFLLQFISELNFNINIENILKQKLRDKEEIIIFGSSQGGRIVKRYIEESGFSVVAFCDNNPDLWGKEINNIPIINCDNLADDKYKSYRIIIASMYFVDIYNQLEQCNIEDRIINFSLIEELNIL
ncbi:glycosyltransferase [Clostridium bornimense]|uniref:glycosyltransferase n=1 Tax=Clostridium bornimense TaxID=1216932 RepID=UPI001C107135|nr:glycosyltransferase [Clostridium bornimense]MBU5314786.1 glycosyltransferase [Clostridium bornimense]